VKNDDKKTKNPASPKLSGSNKYFKFYIIARPGKAAEKKLLPEKFIIVNQT
jgi:hypothetical protein